MQNQSTIDIGNKKKLEHIECLAREREVLLALKISNPWEEMLVLRHCRAHIDVPDKQLYESLQKNVIQLVECFL